MQAMTFGDIPVLSAYLLLVATLFVIATAWLIYLLGRQRAQGFASRVLTTPLAEIDALDGLTVTKTEIDGRRLSPCRSDLPEGKFLIKGQDGVGNLNLNEPLRQPSR